MRQHRTVAAVAVCLSATAASADVVESWYVHPFSFSYKVTHMPDLDQRRGPGAVSLPNNGNMYCVPTSAFNLMAYAANHGFPHASPFPNNWAHPDTYDYAGLGLQSMGSMMNTDPID